VDEVLADYLILSDLKDSSEGSSSGFAACFNDLLIGGRVGKFAGEINYRDIWGWYTESHTGELTVELWDDLSDSLSGTSGGWDDVGAGGTSGSPVFASTRWSVNSKLSGSHGVDSCHQTFDNAEFVIDDLSERS